MGLYAIAALMNRGSLYGIRVVNSITLDVFNWTTGFCMKTIQNGIDIENVGLIGEGVSFTNGALSRYPSIGMSRGVSCRDNITVLYSINKVDGQVYVVANYLGQLVCISEEKLIQYGTKYTLTNSKVTSRGGKSYISSIHGELKIIEDKAIIRSVSSGNRIYIEVPFGISKVVIPSILNGESITSIDNIKATTEVEAYRIQHLVVESGIEYISNGAFKDLPSIKTAQINGDVSTDGSPFDKSSTISKIYIKSIREGGHHWFSELGNLQEVKLGTSTSEHSQLMFNGCRNINLKPLICEGILNISSLAYLNCTQLVDLQLPKTLITLSKSAFAGCNNLRSVTINNRNLYIEEDRYSNVWGKVTKTSSVLSDSDELLGDSNNVVVYHPYSFPLSRISRLVGENARLVRLKPTQEEMLEEKIYNKQKDKYSLLGLKVRKNDTPRSIQELLGALTVISEDNWKRGLIDNITMVLDRCNEVPLRYTVTADCVSIDVSIERLGNSKKALKVLTGDKYIVLICGYTYVMLIGKEELKHRIRRCLDGETLEVMSMTGDYPGVQLIIPVIRLLNLGSIVSVKESDNTLTIEYNTGKKDKFTPDMFN